MNNREFEKTMTDTFSEPEWEEGWERGDMERIYTAGRQSLLPVIGEAAKNIQKIIGDSEYAYVLGPNDLTELRATITQLQSARAEIEGSDV